MLAKTLLVALGLAVMATAAGAHAHAPRIELDLSDLSTATKFDQTIFRAHNDGLTQPNGQRVQSRQDWTERCTAGPDTNPSVCPFPIAKAWDHNDNELTTDIKTRYYLVDVDGHRCGTAAYDCECASSTDEQCQVTEVNFARRSTYLFKYDVTDGSGNHAEQVVFALILDDSCGAKCDPQITSCGKDAETWEAASDQKLCSTGVTAEDTLDGDLGENLLYDIVKLNDAHTTVRKLCTDQSFADYQKTGEGCAKDELATTVPGRYLVTLHVCDAAGVYGADGKNNCVSVQKAIIIRDTEAPVITLHGFNPNYHECGEVYNSDFDDVNGGEVTDKLDTEALKLTIDKPCSGVHKGCVLRGFDGAVLDSNTPDTYKVTYDAWDMAGNQATQAVRTLIVVDRKAPEIKLTGNHHVYHDSTKAFGDATGEAQEKEDGVECEDACDGPLKVTTSWKDGALNDQIVGSYTKVYECTDAADNKATAERVFTVVDKGKPTVTLIGDDEQTIAASRTEPYVEEKAECHDFIDGDLEFSANVQVTGSVDRKVPGTYTLTYVCTDSKGNKSDPVPRTVIVRDTTCPNIKLEGKPLVYVEAGYEYTDKGAKATDDLDGDISDHITTDGLGDVNTRNAFYSRRSCAEIKKAYAQATTGNYYITVYVQTPKPLFQRQLVHCDMDSLDKNDRAVGFTYQKCNGCKAVRPYHSVEGDCPARGLRMVKWDENNANSMAALKADEDWKHYFPNSAAPADADLLSDMYLCGTNDESLAAAEDHASQTNLIKHGKIHKAEAGKYIIKYHVKDSSQNSECVTPERTVIVKDTMPPVISLHMEHGVVHKGNGGEGNLASKPEDNDFLASGYTVPKSEFATSPEYAYANQKWEKFGGRRLRGASV